MDLYDVRCSLREALAVVERAEEEINNRIDKACNWSINGRSISWDEAQRQLPISGVVLVMRNQVFKLDKIKESWFLSVNDRIVVRYAKPPRLYMAYDDVCRVVDGEIGFVAELF